MNTYLNCNTVNIIWTDRGIKLAIMYVIYFYYNKIKHKNIIIFNKNFRNFAKLLFPKLLIFKKVSNTNNNNKNFYFNIRYIIKKQDIFIDYIKNYDNTIFTKKINLIPWYDINDPLIIYFYNKKKNYRY